MIRAQRGFIGGLTLGESIVKLLIILAIVSALAGIALTVKAAIERYNSTLLDAGKAEADAIWKGREIERVGAARAKEKQWREKFEAERQKHADVVAAIVATYREQQKETEAQYEAQHEKDLAAIRAGTLRLRDPGRKRDTTACGGPGTGNAPRSGTAAAGADGAGEKAGELSQQATEFLLAEATDADKTIERITNKLTALQKYTADLYAYCKGR